MSAINYYPPEFRKTVAEYACEHDVNAAVETYHVSQRQVYKWIKRYTDYNYKWQKTSKADKVAILKYAKKHGMSQATRTYGYSLATMRLWNDRYHIITYRSYKTFTPTRKQALLILARHILAHLPAEQRTTKTAFRIIYEKYGIRDVQLYQWNQQYDLLPLKPRRARGPVITTDMIHRAQTAIIATNGNLVAASRQCGISVHHIRCMLRENQISKGVEK